MFDIIKSSSGNRRWHQAVSTSSLMLMLGLATVGLNNEPQKTQRTQEIHEGRVTRSFTEPIETNVVAAIESGVIQTANVKEGDRVRAGEQLAILNSDVLIQSRRRAVALSESTATRDAAKARMEMIRSQKENLETLFPGGHVNQHELSQKVAEYDASVAEHKTADDELVMAEIEVDRIDAQIQQRIIKSPINGFVTRIHKKLGEQVSNNEPQYATIVRIDELKVRFYLDEKTLDSIKFGSQVSVLIGNPSKRVNARVIYVSPIIDPDSGTGRVEVAIQNQDYKIRSGTVCYFEDNNSSGRFAGSNFEGTQKK